MKPTEAGQLFWFRKSALDKEHLVETFERKGRLCQRRYGKLAWDYLDIIEGEWLKANGFGKVL